MISSPWNMLRMNRWFKKVIVLVRAKILWCSYRYHYKDRSLLITKGDKMTQSRLQLDPYTVRVLDVVKGKFGLKSRNEALRKFVEEHGAAYAEPLVEEQVLKEIDATLTHHKKQRAERTMTEKELDTLLGF